MGEIHTAGVNTEDRGSNRSDAAFEAAIGRKPALPLHLVCHPGHNWPSLGYTPGRVVILNFGSHQEDWLAAGESLNRLAPGDVLSVRYFEPYDGPPPFPVVENLTEVRALIRDVGQSVYAVLAGQWVAEVGMTPQPDGSDEARLGSVTACTEFAKQWCDAAREMGARPGLPMIKDQILLHAYWAERTLPEGDPLKPILVEYEPLILCYLGFSFWGMADGTMLALQSDHEHRWCGPGELDRFPYPLLKEWLERSECWGGVDYMPGLQAGNDIVMAANGFKAGVIGELPGQPPPDAPPDPGGPRGPGVPSEDPNRQEA